MHKALDAAQAKVKCIVVMGFPPTADVEAAWTGKQRRVAWVRICSDSRSIATMF